MLVEVILIAILPALLIAAAGWDLASFTIPNMLTAAMLALFMLFAVASALAPHGMTLADFGLHAAAGGIGLVVGIVFFALGWIGGGDAKLFAVAALWLGWHALVRIRAVRIAVRRRADGRHSHVARRADPERAFGVMTGC